MYVKKIQSLNKFLPVEIFKSITEIKSQRKAYRIVKVYSIQVYRKLFGFSNTTETNQYNDKVCTKKNF